MTIVKSTAVLFLALVLGSCIIHVDSKVHRTGRTVGEETLRQIEPGRDESFVLALLGEPTRRMTVESGELWKWESTETRTREGGLIFVFSTEPEDTTVSAVWVELRAGKVVRQWRD